MGDEERDSAAGPHPPGPTPDELRALDRLLRRSGRAGHLLIDTFLAEKEAAGAADLGRTDFDELCRRLDSLGGAPHRGAGGGASVMRQGSVGG